MTTSYKNGNTTAKPSTVTINCVLDALAKSGEREASNEAKALLLRMRDSTDPCFDTVNLDTISYTSVIDAYAKSGAPDAAQNAEEVFELMKTDYENGNMAAKPNTKTVNTVMNAWVQSGRKGSTSRADTLLRKLEDSTDETLQPDVVSYSIVMKGYAKSSEHDAVSKTKQVFDRMVAAYEGGNPNARPNVHSYTALITAILRSNARDAAERAERIVRIMQKEYEEGNEYAKPTTLALTMVIDAWAKSGHRDAGERAEALLNWLLDIYDETNDPAVEPNAMTFSAAMNAWAKSKDFQKSLKAKTILDKMIALHESGKMAAKPNTLVITTLINACAYTQGEQSAKTEAFHTATEAFKQLYKSKYGRPNHVTYTTYMVACRNLLPAGEGRTQSIEAVLRRCCQDGQLDKIVVEKAERIMEPERLQAFFGDAVSRDNRIDLTLLPQEWTKNVQSKPRRQQQRQRPRYHNKSP